MTETDFLPKIEALAAQVQDLKRQLDGSEAKNEPWADDLESPDWVPPPGNLNPPPDVEGFGDRMRAHRKGMKKKKSSG
jgi:hypothetical protein